MLNRFPGFLTAVTKLIYILSLQGNKTVCRVCQIYIICVIIHCSSTPKYGYIFWVSYVIYFWQCLTCCISPVSPSGSTPQPSLPCSVPKRLTFMEGGLPLPFIKLVQVELWDDGNTLYLCCPVGEPLAIHGSWALESMANMTEDLNFKL